MLFNKRDFSTGFTLLKFICISWRKEQCLQQKNNVLGGFGSDALLLIVIDGKIDARKTRWSLFSVQIEVRK